MATAVQTDALGTRTALTITGLSTLASATYVASNALTLGGLNAIFELQAATTNAPAGNNQLLIWLICSIDATNYDSGPTSGTTATREKNLGQSVALPILVTATTETMHFDVKGMLGFIPTDVKVVIKNDLGVALTSASLNYSLVSPTLTY